MQLLGVTLLGAAGLYAFERERPDGQALPDFATALWWTGTIMTTMGTYYWPRTGASDRTWRAAVLMRLPVAISDLSPI